MYLLYLPLVSLVVCKYVLNGFSAEKTFNDVPFMAGKTKSRHKILQTPENSVHSLSETGSFGKIVMAS